MKLSSAIVLFLLAATITNAQKLPIIKASSKTISIKDGDYLYKNTWNLSPTARPDIYTADRTRQTKWVTFYTDQDSIRTKVKPGSVFNFIILLNGKDSCFTQITSALAAPSKVATAVVPDTIPFTLTTFNAISVKATLNDTVSINMHFDLSAFDFCILKDVMTAQLPKISSAKVQLGTITWPAMHLRPTTVTAHEMQGRIGYNLFEGKIVQINYDSHLLIISNKLPSTKGYQKTPIDFIQSYVCIKAQMAVRDKMVTADFLLDNGSAETVMLDSSFAAQQNFAQGLPLLRTSMLKDPRGVQYITKVVEAPQITLGKYSLQKVPATIFAGRNPTNLPLNLFGNDYLKRFNLIVDFTTDNIYFKPNQLWREAFRG